MGIIDFHGMSPYIPVRFRVAKRTPGEFAMELMVGYCGLDCAGCLIHQATLERDEQKRYAMRSDVARICRERYGLSVETDDVGDCDGCRSETLFVTCSKCEIRKCATGKNLVSCAFCGQYACHLLQQIFIEDSGARGRLDKLRNHL